jgi:hypothetical protein
LETPAKLNAEEAKAHVPNLAKAQSEVLFISVLQMITARLCRYLCGKPLALPSAALVQPRLTFIATKIDTETFWQPHLYLAVINQTELLFASRSTSFVPFFKPTTPTSNSNCWV